jgi:hypothetical protein
MLATLEVPIDPDLMRQIRRSEKVFAFGPRDVLSGRYSASR